MPLLEILNRHKVKGTFFVSILEILFFKGDEITKCIELLLEYEQDVQLHTHPNWYNGKDNMWNCTEKEQNQIVSLATKELSNIIGYTPYAHRAGAYGADSCTLKVLKDNGFKIDSSLFIGHDNCRIPSSNPNPHISNDLLLVPIDHFSKIRIRKLGWTKKLCKLDHDWCSFGTIINYVRNCSLSKKPLLNYFMHSYSVLDWDSKFRFKESTKKLKKLDLVLNYVTNCADIEITDSEKLYQSKDSLISSDFSEMICL